MFTRYDLLNCVSSTIVTGEYVEGTNLSEALLIPDERGFYLFAYDCILIVVMAINNEVGETTMQFSYR